MRLDEGIAVLVAAVLVAGPLAIIGALASSVLRERAPRRWQLLGQAAFVAFAIAVVALLSAVGTFFTAAMGDNTIAVEDGHHVAHYGVPIRYATGTFESWSHYGDLGDDAPFNPWEIRTDVDASGFTLAWAFWFAVLALPTLTLYVAARRRARARPPRPSARPYA